MPPVIGLETDDLLQLVEQIKQNRETGKTVRTASTNWKGGFKRVRTCSPAFTLSADAPDMPRGVHTAVKYRETLRQFYRN